ncbi:hypothetical protein SPFM6_00219 [Salmonella phage SPFM6]|nr:hypothetical protein SPFM6_00219 [Salmonella phage SPFM6]
MQLPQHTYLLLSNGALGNTADPVVSIYEAVQENVPIVIPGMYHSVDKHDVVTVA